MKCDNCQGLLYTREDDKPATVQNRLKVYRKETAPLINFYRRRSSLKEVECNRVDIKPETIIKIIIKLLKEKRRVGN